MKKGKTKMNSTEKFDGRAKNYAASRSSYAAELIDCLFGQFGLDKARLIADIGSGTGKFSKLLLDGKRTVYCVEPNEDMRSAAEKELCEYAGFRSVAGSAEHTTLKDCSVDCVTAAQCFHWFDVPKFKKECLRIVKNGGRVFLIWNSRDCEDVINREWREISLRYCPDFNGFGNGIEYQDKKIAEFFENRYDYVSFDYPLIFDRERFIKRCLSSSYAPKENDVDFERYVSALNCMFDKYQLDGNLFIANKSVAYVGTVK